MDVGAIEGALRLRGWALAHLFGDAEEAGPPPTEPASTWDVFLRRERCAQALLTSLPDERPTSPDPSLSDVVVRNATRQAQRVLAARGQLGRIGAAVEKAGIPTIVLKGGAAVARGQALGDLVDLDLLVPPDRTEDALQLLDDAGYRTAPPKGSVTHHETPRQLPNLVPVEVHFEVPAISTDELDGLWERARMVEGLPGIRMFPPVDEAWHVLVHSSLQHAHRRGCIRELLLLRDALGRCSREEREQVRQRVTDHRERTFLSPWFEMAERATVGVPEDPFRRVAAADYLFLGAVTPTGLPRSAVFPVAALTFHLLGERAGPSPWAEAAADLPTARPSLRMLRRIWPPLERAALFAIREGRLVAAFPVARLLARRVRAAVD